MEESPKEKDKDRMFDEKPDYGQSLRKYIRWMITTNSSYRERVQDPDRRARAIKELVSKWRKDQITHTDYKGESKPDLYKQAIVKHAPDWFESRIKKEMREMDIPLKRHKQETLTEALKKGGERGKRKQTKQERRSRSTKKFMQKQKRKAKD